MDMLTLLLKTLMPDYTLLPVLIVVLMTAKALALVSPAVAI